MTLPKFILFDADGTLYDSEQINYEANRLTAKAMHDFDLTVEAFDTHVRRGSKRTYMLLEEAGHNVDREAYLAERRKHYERLVLTDLMTLPGLIGFLQWCDEQGVGCGVVSSMQRVQLEFALRSLAIDGYFKFVIGLEDAHNKPKPDPYPYLQGIEKAGFSVDQIIAIEDTDKGLTSATVAGLRCYGIRNSFDDVDSLDKAEAVIQNYDELKQLLTANQT